MSAAPVNPARRSLMRAGSAAGLLAASGTALGSPADPWQRARMIKASFATALSFRKEDFPITAYGAKPAELARVKGQLTDETAGMLATPAAGSHDCHGAIAAAIAACHKAGGGRVLIPAGNWHCAGPIVLRSKCMCTSLPVRTCTSAPIRPITRAMATSIAAQMGGWCARAGRAMTVSIIHQWCTRTDRTISP
jgi:hypothetical protein